MNNNHKIVEFNQIIDLIYLGTNLCCSAFPHIKILLDHGIKADIDLEKERQEQTPNIDTYLWLPVADQQAPTQEQLDTGFAVIDRSKITKKFISIAKMVTEDRLHF